MTKTLQRVVCLCLFTAVLLAALPLSAHGAGTPTFRVSNAQGKPGDTVTVTVSTEHNPGIIALRLFIAYDAAVLELTDAVGQDLSGITFGPLTKNPLITTWVDGVHPDNTTNGVLVKMTFRIRSGAPSGASPITLSYEPGDVLNTAWENVTFATVAGGVTVSGGSAAADKPRHSVTEADDADRGLGFRFSVPAQGVKTDRRGNGVLTAARVQYQGTACPLLRMGALLTADTAIGNDEGRMVLGAAGVTNAVAAQLCDVTDTACTYAVRILHIPDRATQRIIYARPYYVVQYQGKETVVYGAIDATTYRAQRP